MAFDLSEFDVADDQPLNVGASRTTPEEIDPQLLQGSQTSAGQFDAKMSEVEKRIELATVYRTILNNSLFTERTQSIDIVESEIRDFIVSRLAVLLNIDQSKEKEVVPVPAVAVFSDDEILALKAIAKKIIGTTSGKEVKVPPPQKKEPELNKIAGPTARRGPAKAIPVTATASSTSAEAPVQKRQRRGYSPHAQPMPTGAAFTALSAAQAQQGAASAIEAGGSVGQQLVAAALLTPAKTEE